MSAWNVSDLLCAAARKLGNFCVHNHTNLKKLYALSVRSSFHLPAQPEHPFLNPKMREVSNPFSLIWTNNLPTEKKNPFFPDCVKLILRSSFRIFACLIPLRHPVEKGGVATKCRALLPSSHPSVSDTIIPMKCFYLSHTFRKKDIEMTAFEGRLCI
jgi:hypothetical protein